MAGITTYLPISEDVRATWASCDSELVLTSVSKETGVVLDLGVNRQSIVTFTISKCKRKAPRMLFQRFLIGKTSNKQFCDIILICIYTIDMTDCITLGLLHILYTV